MSTTGDHARRKVGWMALCAVLSVGLLGSGWLVTGLVKREAGSTANARHDGPVPVEVTEVRRGPMERRRVFTGTLEAAASVDVAAKVGGRVERIAVDLGDVVTRGQLVAELDDEEYRQAVAQARAELAVATAQKAAAEKALEIARRAFQRVEGLYGRSISSEQELDTARAAKLEAEAAVAVAVSQTKRAQAALQAASVRERYTKVTADWSEGDDTRVVAARYVDEGATVTANTPLLSIVELDPAIVVVYVTEKDYANLRIGQPVAVETDAYPGETFSGTVSRMAPVFRVESRQARVELSVDNGDGRLKPGMFVRAHTVLEHVEDAIAVPRDALVDRDDQKVVFVVSEDGKHVERRTVDVDFESEGWARVIGEGIAGRVVTLGQQQLDDGSEIVIPDEVES